MYRSLRRQDTYLLVPEAHALEHVPDSLLEHFGEAHLSFTFTLTNDRSLQRVEPEVLREQLETAGYFPATAATGAPVSWWNELPLEALDEGQWEALCDGCARCCLIKLQDEDTDEVFYTSVACRVLDLETARCTRYPQRHEVVPDCVNFAAAEAAAFDWLPDSCAYRKRARGEPLDWWHPLVSGTPDTVVEAGISVLGHVDSEDDVDEDDLEERLIVWVKAGDEDE